MIKFGFKKYCVFVSVTFLSKYVDVGIQFSSFIFNFYPYINAFQAVIMVFLSFEFRL